MSNKRGSVDFRIGFVEHAHAYTPFPIMPNMFVVNPQLMKLVWKAAEPHLNSCGSKLTHTHTHTAVLPSAAGPV